MGLKCGIVGLPNVGKSSLYNALSNGNAMSANFPFCTIEPNIGVVKVPDDRLLTLTNLVNPERAVPTTMSFVDIAGLVKGASKGEGLGNQFLAHIREVDAIIHVIRCFDNDDIIHVAGGVNPIFDKDIINYELQQADLDTLERKKLKIHKKAKSGDKKAAEEIELIEYFIEGLSEGKDARVMKVTDEEKKIVEQWQLLSDKKVIYVANVGEKTINGEKNQYLEELQLALEKERAEVIPICVGIESELASMEEEDKKDFLAMYALRETGLHKLVQAAYRMLSLITYFTVGPKEVRAWTIPNGALAPVAAGVIHSDFKAGFIKVEVIKYDHYLMYKNEENCRKAGKIAIEGKEYAVQDGDILHFKCRT